MAQLWHHTEHEARAKYKGYTRFHTSEGNLLVQRLQIPTFTSKLHTRTQTHTQNLLNVAVAKTTKNGVQNLI